MVFLAKAYIPGSGYRSKSLGEALQSKLHKLVINSVISECCILFLELNNKTSILFGLELLLFVSNSKPDGHDGDQSECNVCHCGSFLRVFNIPTDFPAKAYTPWRGIGEESLLLDGVVQLQEIADSIVIIKAPVDVLSGECLLVLPLEVVTLLGHEVGDVDKEEDSTDGDRQEDRQNDNGNDSGGSHECVLSE